MNRLDPGTSIAVTLPAFVVIGAMKAGTVSLRPYLEEHPDVYVWRGETSSEPNFFVAEQNWPRDRLAGRLATDLDRFEHLPGHQVPSDWSWSASAPA